MTQVSDPTRETATAPMAGGLAVGGPTAPSSFTLPIDGPSVIANDRAHVFHPWAMQQGVRQPVARAEGSRFWDFDGREFIDFSSGLVHANLGYGHPGMIAAIQEQVGRIATFAPGFAMDVRSEAARLIAERAPEGLDVVFFTNGGAEATENAMRMARLATGRHKVLATYRSYHGGTAGAVTMTGEPRRIPNEPGIPGVVHFWGPYPYRSVFHSDSPEQESERALAHLRDTIMVEGPQAIAAIILESVVGTNGILVPPDGYLAGVREICDEHGILLIADEVMAGFGRCGEWFAIQHWGVRPDLITFTKGVNSGYVPLGGVILSHEVAAVFAQRVYPGGLTYSGHPLACGSAVASIQIYEADGVLEHARMLGRDVIGPGLAELAERHPSIGDVRGLGVFWAVELVRDRHTREPLVPFNASGEAARPMAEFAAACKARGLWPFVHYNRTHVVPPIVTSPADLREGLARLDEALTVADGYVRS